MCGKRRAKRLVVRPHILFRQMAERVLIQYPVRKENAHPFGGCAFSLEQMTGNFAFLQISNILCINADFRHYILNICAITGLLCHILWVRFG